ncbi:hypothetical protein [Sporosarcina sp. FSL W7-1283]|uniref:hypothetical protein n=1 Tax=Sporosarcina sp. FSL W7-1283 TaxID=2921560 RepID=UPI0030FB2B96
MTKYRVYDNRNDKTLFESEDNLDCLNYMTTLLVEKFDDDIFDEEFESICMERVE